MSGSDGAPAASERRRPWFWVGTDATALIRRERAGEEGRPGLCQALAVYGALVEVANGARARTKPGEESQPFTAERCRLAALSGVSESTVKRSLALFERVGLLRVERRRIEHDRNRPNVYVLAEPDPSGGGVPEEPQVSVTGGGVPEEPQGGGPDPQGGVPRDPQGGGPEDPELLKKEKAKKNNKKNNKSADADPGVVTELFEFWSATLQKRNPKLSEKRKRKVRARLREGFTADEIRAAIVGLTYSDHHMGRNGSPQKYDDLELICRDPEHVERFRDLYTEKRGKGGDAAFKAFLHKPVESAGERQNRRREEVLADRRAGAPDRSAYERVEPAE